VLLVTQLVVLVVELDQLELRDHKVLVEVVDLEDLVDLEALVVLLLAETTTLLVGSKG
jgi:hypothetical protein